MLNDETLARIISSADRIDFDDLDPAIHELPEEDLRDLIRALERAHDHATADLSRRHGGIPYSGMGGLLENEVDQDG